MWWTNMVKQSLKEKHSNVQHYSQSACVHKPYIMFGDKLIISQF